MSKKISINLYIAEHHFPLTVTNKEEEVLRKAAKILNDKLKSWTTEAKYSNLSKEKLMAGAALAVTAQLLEENKISGEDTVEKELEEIRILLEDSMMDS